MSRFADQSLPRRSFLRGHFLNTLQSDQVKQQGHNAIRPPWADLTQFTEKCTACGKCQEACESRIIVRGAGGFPEIQFSQGECTFCQKCVDVCPEPVFRSTTETPWTHKVEIQQNCLLKQRIECRSCGDSCESRAIRFRPKLGGIVELVLTLESCNGCGACLSVCPTQAIHILKVNEEE
ncbi:ferredoxin-type protein NapF [Pasteurellaceae bacterium Pebbles2]|nr:ferredoxin-type protein NapF [Pasteurellaceae bacterium Pebbles2]